MLAIFAILLAGCSQAPGTKVEATTAFRLLDVTSSGTKSSNQVAESYWQIPSSSSILRCIHDVGREGIYSPRACYQFSIPTGIPAGAVLLALNIGTGQKNQSVWDVGDKRMLICNHSRDWWSRGTTSSVDGCEKFLLPKDVATRAILASMNSGEKITAQTFWNTEDGGVTVCDHNTISNGFLGLGGGSFGEEYKCQKMNIPTNLFPADFKSPVLAAITSDVSSPWESLWQNADGIVVHCMHDYNGGGLFSNETIGAAKYCNYWNATSVKM